LPNLRVASLERGGKFLLIQLLAKTTKQTLLCLTFPILSNPSNSFSLFRQCDLLLFNKQIIFSSILLLTYILRLQVLSDLVRKNGIYYRKTLRWNCKVIGIVLNLGGTSHVSRIDKFLRNDYVAKGRRDFS
jgi:hypothetical protein